MTALTDFCVFFTVFVLGSSAVYVLGEGLLTLIKGGDE